MSESDLPQWAYTIAFDVCRGTKRGIPEIHWRVSKNKSWTSGTTWSDHIAITAGLGGRGIPQRTEHKIVLLHELSHWLTPGHHHDRVFWDQMYKLIHRYNIPLNEAVLREKNSLRLAWKRATYGK